MSNENKQPGERATTCPRCRGTGYHYEWCMLATTQPDERAANEEIARAVHAEMSRIPGATFYNAAKEALDRATAPQAAKGDERAYAVYRTRPDENDGKEYFSVAHWHNDYIAQEGERIVTGRFVPDRAAVPQAEQRMSDAEDAARYRWLRDNKHLDAWWSVSGPADRCTNIDADIDAALAAQQPQEGA